MGDARTAMREQLQLLFCQMNAVCEDAALTEQAVAVVNIRVLSLGEKIVDPLDLVLVLRDMRMDVRVRKLALELTRGFEQFRRRGRRETRRDRVAQQPALVPFLQ